eukprot:CAMPEP_0172458840 /NCGR_PEP_ID=MMETSP1065-20121228/29476_1 /TAXON_ID=265537 /ORGANISM="Amphiprora paludosa, Strain CCMP125" /LENGTH=336 /DNA_ID=CAMNT_0013213261 /DNA_START=30 /DNA_END=1040 /DNA_ORIENTATION=-
MVSPGLLFGLHRHGGAMKSLVSRHASGVFQGAWALSPGLPTQQQGWFSSRSGDGAGARPNNFTNNRKLLRSKLMRSNNRGGGGGRNNGRPGREGGGRGFGPPREDPDAASWPQARFGLRRNVPITVLPGNFNNYRLRDYDPKYDGDKIDEDLKPEPDALDADNSPIIDENRMIADILKKQKAAKEALKEKWIKSYKTPKRIVSKIDPQGRSYSRGARKSASARVWIQPGFGEFVVNSQDYCEYFMRESHREHMLEPLVVTDTVGKFDVMATVRGGGHTGQAGAIRYGIAHALQAYNPELYRPTLRYKGLLTRDSRQVERKKIGFVKARKRPTWVRR